MEISQDENESEPLLFCHQFLSNYLLKISQNNLTFASNLLTEILEPFELVAKNYNENNKEIIINTTEVFFQLIFEY